MLVFKPGDFMYTYDLVVTDFSTRCTVCLHPDVAVLVEQTAIKPGAEIVVSGHDIIKGAFVPCQCNTPCALLGREEH